MKDFEINQITMIDYSNNSDLSYLRFFKSSKILSLGSNLSFVSSSSFKFHYLISWKVFFSPSSILVSEKTVFLDKSIK